MSEQAKINMDNLSAEEKRVLLARLLQQREQRTRLAPLSFGQERLWFLHQLNPANAAYNLRTAVRLQGCLNIPVLQESIQETVNRHESLRTTVISENGRSWQQIHSQVAIPLPIIDLSHIEINQQESAIQIEADREAQTPFDFSKASLLRAKLLKLTQDDYILLLTMHHIISDGWSIGILISEIATLYQAKAAEKPALLNNLPIQYADFATWQKEQLQSKALQRQLDYWLAQLQDTAVLDFPADYPRPPMQTFVGARHYFAVPPTISQQLRQLTQAENATLFMTLLAAFNILLHIYSGQSDIVVGTPIAGRTRQQLEGLIGLFINTLVMRNQVDAQASFRTHLSEVRQTALEAFANQDIPFEKLVKELNPPRDPGRSPCFQHAFVLQNAPMEAVDLAGLTLTTLKPDKASSLFDLTLSMWDNQEGLHGYLEYNTDLFSAATISRIVTHFQQLLAQIGQHPNSPIAQLNILSAAEKQQILFDWNDTAADFSLEENVHTAIEKHAAAAPEALAISQNGQTLTYKEMNEQANKLAHHLRALGVKPGSFVAICVERSPALIWGMLGIMKAGAAYVPLDIEHPKDRLAYVLADTGTPILLTQTHLLDELPTEGVQIVALDEFQANSAQLEAANPVRQTTEEDVAYAIYTSGSTGKPKGVPITHRALNNLIGWYCTTFDICAEDRAGQFAGLAFDASVLEIWPHLASGASLHLSTPEVRQDPIKLYEWLIQEALSICYIPTPLAEVMLDLHWPDTCPLRLMLTGGSKLRRHPPVGLPFKLVDNYGPTECTVVTTFLVVPPSNDTTAVPTIGRPVSNTRLYVLNKALNPVPVGVAGELYVGGPSLTKGYINQPELSAQKLVPDPFDAEANGRLYATGDIVRYRADGQLEFIGRVDNQIKIRGFRVELGEIEAALLQHERVLETAVIMHKTPAGKAQLVAYIAFANKEAVDPEGLQAFLKTSLPQYMIPTIFVTISALPMTPNGKVDHRALPDPTAFIVNANHYVAPRNETEAQLVEIWQELLKVEKIGVQDNFFELGGDSLLVIQAVSQARRMGWQITAQEMFQNQTIAELAPLAQNLAADEQPEMTFTGEWPLTADQQWFLSRNLIEPHRYTAVSNFKVSVPLDAQLLKESVQYLIEYHDIFRSRFVQDDSGWHQIVAAAMAEVPFYEHELDLSNIPPEDDYQIYTEEAYTKIRNAINLGTGPVLQLHYIHLRGMDSDRLLLAIHHLVIDGVSINIALQDLLHVYTQRLQGKNGQLPPKSINARQWVERLQTYADTYVRQQELDYWLNLPWNTVPGIPVDFVDAYAKNTVESSAKEPEDRISVHLTAEETAFMLRDMPKQHNLSIETMMLAAMTKAITEWSGGEWFSTKMIDNGRNQLTNMEEIDLSRTVGWLSFTRRLMLQWQPEQDLLANVSNIDQQIKAMPNRGLGYEILLRYSQNAETVTAVQKTIPDTEDIWINYVGQISGGNSLLQPANERAGWHMNPQNKRDYLLFCYAEIRDNQFVMQWEYSIHVHQRETIEQVAHTFIETMKKVVRELCLEKA